MKLENAAQSLAPSYLATLACHLEVTAPKPGNVHRGADFEDVGLNDFLTSAVILGESLERNTSMTLGHTIFDCVDRNRVVVGSNTNLGIILLLAPLVKVAQQEPGREITPTLIEQYLQSLDGQDGRLTLEAIALAKPGGLGTAAEMDVNQDHQEVDLLDAMRVAEQRDAVARMFVSGFADVFGQGLEWLEQGRRLFPELSQANVYTHVRWMAEEPDSLIARKCGADVAANSQRMARQAIDCLATGSANTAASESERIEEFWRKVGELDFWLRSDGHRRNPGTTADLVTATLFVALYNRVLEPPF